MKVILVLLFATVLHSVANDFFTDRTVEENSNVALNVPHKIMQTTLSAAQLPYFPDAELIDAGIQLQQVFVSRIQRINATKYLLSLKFQAQNLAKRTAALTLHLERIYDTTTSYYCHPVSEYYVFALRRIIV